HFCRKYTPVVEGDGDLVCPIDDVMIGDHIAVFRNDEAGTHPATRPGASLLIAWWQSLVRRQSAQQFLDLVSAARTPRGPLQRFDIHDGRAIALDQCSEV